jgi:hypothetical protein
VNADELHCDIRLDLARHLQMPATLAFRNWEDAAQAAEQI